MGSLQSGYFSNSLITIFVFIPDYTFFKSVILWDIRFHSSANVENMKTMWLHLTWWCQASRIIANAEDKLLTPARVSHRLHWEKIPFIWVLIDSSTRVKFFRKTGLLTYECCPRISLTGTHYEWWATPALRDYEAKFVN